MADAKKEQPCDGDTLLRRLRRLQARAGSARASDWAQLLALTDDVDTLLRQLRDESARLEDEIKRAAVRSTAMTAYRRGARLVRRPRCGGL